MSNFLYPIKKQISIRNIWALDTEDDSKGNVLLIGLYDGKNYYHFKDQIKAILFIENLPAKKTIHFYCCNLAYDLVNLFDGFFYMLEVVYNGSYIVYAKLKNKNIFFADTLNHCKISVAEMGKLVGLKKLKFDRQNLKYNKRDCEIVYKFMERVQSNYQSLNCECKLTMPASALDCFRRNYLNSKIKKPDDKIIELLRKAYYGGRCEIFRLNKIKGKIFHYDINSLYPFVMSSNRYPNPNYFKYYNGDHNFDLDIFGVANADVFCPQMNIPILPYKTKFGKLIFPTGEFSGTWSLIELKRAVENGYEIKRINWHIQYPYSDNYFKNFVSDLYSVRMNSKTSIDKLMYKIFMNSLYGKFAQNNITYELIPLEKSDGTEVHILDDMVFHKFIGEYPNHANIIWSVYTTSYARLLLYNYLKLVDEKADLLYCDTDCVIYRGKKSLIRHSKKLGGMKLEGEFSTAEFKLPKFYMMKNKTHECYVAKGVPHFLSKDFFEFGSVEYDRPTKLRESLRRGIKANVWIKTKRKNIQVYDKRQFFDDGSTSPLTISF